MHLIVQLRAMFTLPTMAPASVTYPPDTTTLSRIIINPGAVDHPHHVVVVPVLVPVSKPQGWKGSVNHRNTSTVNAASQVPLVRNPPFPLRCLHHLRGVFLVLIAEMIDQSPTQEVAAMGDSLLDHVLDLTLVQGVQCNPAGGMEGHLTIISEPLTLSHLERQVVLPSRSLSVAPARVDARTAHCLNPIILSKSLHRYCWNLPSKLKASS
ncbi:hypothetical protein BKA70DRAFT_1440666 [Coprinopsis sp. MPI-PUGE-AT-0042]|nr:hypothetical protein BKA70DRAFT_1440666 [Coprinopsis sp. MPI-PUGE-AT-0042]